MSTLLGRSPAELETFPKQLVARDVSAEVQLAVIVASHLLDLFPLCL